MIFQTVQHGLMVSLALLKLWNKVQLKFRNFFTWYWPSGFIFVRKYFFNQLYCIKLTKSFTVCSNTNIKTSKLRASSLDSSISNCNFTFWKGKKRQQTEETVFQKKFSCKNQIDLEARCCCPTIFVSKELFQLV